MNITTILAHTESAVSAIPLTYFLVMCAIAGSALIAAGINLRKLWALRELMVFSPHICFICRRDAMGHQALEDFGEIDPVHAYVPALLVYLPDQSEERL